MYTFWRIHTSGCQREPPSIRCLSCFQDWHCEAYSWLAIKQSWQFLFDIGQHMFFFLDQIKKSSLALCSTAAPCPSKRVHLHCLAVVRISVGGSAGSSVRDYCREPGPFPSTHVRWLSATCNPSSGASDALYWLPEAAASMWYTQSHPDAHTHIISIINKQI